MTQKNKELLLKDLCTRFPYGVICQFIWTYSNETTDGEEVIAKENDNIKCIDIHTKEIQADYCGEWVDLEDCKPYLRPMSSMTKEEKIEYDGMSAPTAQRKVWVNRIDWLNSHHFDYRGLIEKSLALEAPKGMY